MSIVREEGIRGIYRGLFPVVGPIIFIHSIYLHRCDRWCAKERTQPFVLRRTLPLSNLCSQLQGRVNNFQILSLLVSVLLRDWSQYTPPCHSSTSSLLFSILLGCWCMQWIISVIKTRMQSLTARQQYKNSFHCAYRIFTEEGVLRFWTGTTPRLVRLMVSFITLSSISISHFAISPTPISLLICCWFVCSWVEGSCLQFTKKSCLHSKNSRLTFSLILIGIISPILLLVLGVCWSHYLDPRMQVSQGRPCNTYKIGSSNINVLKYSLSWPFLS